MYSLVEYISLWLLVDLVDIFRSDARPSKINYKKITSACLPVFDFCLWKTFSNQKRKQNKTKLTYMYMSYSGTIHLNQTKNKVSIGKRKVVCHIIHLLFTQVLQLHLGARTLWNINTHVWFKAWMRFKNCMSKWQMCICHAPQIAGLSSNI